MAHVIVGLGTNDLLDGGIVLHPIFGFPVIPRNFAQGGEPAYAQGFWNGPRESSKSRWERRARTNLDAETLCSWKMLHVAAWSSSLT